MKVHLDTDFGGDTDDACALAMLLGWPGVEITGITTVADRNGLRAAYVRYVLSMVGREDIPVEAGAAASLTSLEVADPVMDDARYWPTDLAPQPSRPGAAVELLTRNIGDGAAVVAIGPYTNLALLEVMAPGSLGQCALTVMGGWIEPPDEGLPPWGPEMDFNVQWDTRAAEIVFASASALTLVPLAPTLKAHLRAADLPRLRASGPLGDLLAQQSEARGADYEMATLGRAHAGLPDDLLNFQYDPVTCGVALGWDGATVKEMRLRPVCVEGSLRLQGDSHGRLRRIVTDLDGDRFAQVWLWAVDQVK